MNTPWVLDLILLALGISAFWVCFLCSFPFIFGVYRTEPEHYGEPDVATCLVVGILLFAAIIVMGVISH